MGIPYKEEETDSVLNEKQNIVAAITESKMKLKGTMGTNSYIVIYIGVNGSTRT
jgi:hypothetical protein